MYILYLVYIHGGSRCMVYNITRPAPPPPFGGQDVARPSGASKADPEPLFVSYPCPVLFLSLSYPFPILVLCYSYPLPILFLSFSYICPILFLYLSYPLPISFLYSSYLLPSGAPKPTLNPSDNGNSSNCPSS